MLILPDSTFFFPFPHTTTAFVNNTRGSYLYAFCLNLTKSASYKNHNRITSPSSSSIVNENPTQVIMTSYWKEDHNFNPINVHVERTIAQKYEDVDNFDNQFVSAKYLDWLCTKVLQGTTLYPTQIYFILMYYPSVLEFFFFCCVHFIYF